VTRQDLCLRLVVRFVMMKELHRPWKEYPMGQGRRCLGCGLELTQAALGDLCAACGCNAKHETTIDSCLMHRNLSRISPP